MFESTVIREPVVQFRSKSILMYDRYHRTEGGFNKSTLFTQNAAKLVKRERYTGKMTAGAKKRLSKAVSLLVQTAQNEYILNPVTGRHQYHRLAFITLTLPDVEVSKDAKFTHKNLLQPFLRTMRRKHGMKSYVWKAELQRNGSVHYHITTHSFIPYTDIRDCWNNLTRKHGMLEVFREEYGHDNPNSIDVHSVQAVQNIEAYLIKYVAKETQNEERMNGKVWDCSMNLKKSNYFTTTETEDITKRIFEDVGRGFAKVYEAEYCSIITYKHDDYFLSFSQEVIKSYYSHLNSILTWDSENCYTETITTQKSKSKSSAMKQPEKRSRSDKREN